MLEVKNAKIEINGRTLIDGLSMVAEDGELTCIVGDNGSGKSSLLRAMLGLQTLSEGFISIDGELLTAASAEAFRQFIAYVPQELSIPATTVGGLGSLVFMLNVNSGKKYSDVQYGDELDKLKLPREIVKSNWCELSGSEQYCAMVALCGLQKKPLVIVDEPQSALDPEAAKVVIEYLQGLATDSSAVIMASSDMELAQKADKIIRITRH